jgi:hypothetical protein
MSALISKHHWLSTIGVTGYVAKNKGSKRAGLEGSGSPDVKLEE